MYDLPVFHSLSLCICFVCLYMCRTYALRDAGVRSLYEYGRGGLSSRSAASSLVDLERSVIL